MGSTTGRFISSPPTLTDGAQQDLRVDSTGALVTANSVGGATSTPEFNRVIGGTTIAVGQAASSISPAAATQIVATRAGRVSVIISNITGTQPVYFVATAVTTGATTGFFLAGTAGATVTIPTTAAVFATSPTAAQTLSYMEIY